MGEGTLYRRAEQHRDRWSVFGAADGIRHLSERLSAEELKQYPIFEDFKDRFLETISPDVSVALWREGAVLFEEGSYVDVAFFLIEGSAAAYLAKHAAAETPSGPIFAGPRDAASSGAGTTGEEADGEGTVYFQRSQQETAGGETTFLSTMDFDLAGDGDVVSLGPGDCFGEIGGAERVAAVGDGEDPERERRGADPGASAPADEEAGKCLSGPGQPGLPPARPAASTARHAAVSWSARGGRGRSGDTGSAGVL